MSEGTASIIIGGNLGGEPRTKDVGGQTVLEFSVAVNSRQKVNGNYQDVPAWYNVSLFGKRGESLVRLLHKGSGVTVSGRLTPRPYQTKDGKPGLSLDVKAWEVVLGSRQDGQGARPQHTTVSVDACLGHDPDGDGDADAMQGADDIPF